MQYSIFWPSRHVLLKSLVLVSMSFKNVVGDKGALFSHEWSITWAVRGKNEVRWCMIEKRNRSTLSKWKAFGG